MGQESVGIEGGMIGKKCQGFGRLEGLFRGRFIDSEER